VTGRCGRPGATLRPLTAHRSARMLHLIYLISFSSTAEGHIRRRLDGSRGSFLVVIASVRSGLLPAERTGSREHSIPAGTRDPGEYGPSGIRVLSFDPAEARAPRRVHSSWGSGSSFDPAGDRLLGEFGQLGLGLLGEYGPVGLGLFGSSWGSGSRESSVQLGLGLLESTVSGTGHGEPSGSTRSMPSQFVTRMSNSLDSILG
jgi:hypothetical protein